MAAMEGSSFATSVVQVTNIAPQATRDQMNTLFSFVGRVEEVRLYPSVRDAGITVTSRCCFVRFADPANVTVTLHLNNTVFIDRAIIITPVLGNKMPEENEGLVMAMQVQQQQQQGGIGAMSSAFGRAGGNNDVRILAANPGLVSMTEDGQISTQDAALEEASLPPYPLLPASVPVWRVEEIRRTVTVAGLDSTVSAQQCMEFFAEKAGEVKYFRYCTRENDTVKYALVEFTERSSVVEALNLNGSFLGTSVIHVMHATEPINKPQNKSNEAAQKEIEEAMSKVKEANCLVSAAVDPLMGMLGAVATAGAGLTTTMGIGMGMRSTRSRSRGMSNRRSRSHGRRRRSRSRSRKRSKSRERPRRHRSRSRERRRHRKSRSRSRDRRKRSKSRDKDKDKERHIKREGGGGGGGGSSSNGKKEEQQPAENEEKEKENGKVAEGDSNSVAESSSEKRRSRSRSRRRSKSKERRRRSKSREKKRRRSRSRSREKRKRSRSRGRRRGSSKDRHRRSKSKDRKRSRSRGRKAREESPAKKGVENKVTRDYDQEEVGFESEKGSSKPVDVVVKTEPKADTMEAQDMEISDSP